MLAQPLSLLEDCYETVKDFTQGMYVWIGKNSCMLVQSQNLFPLHQDALGPSPSDHE